MDRMDHHSQAGSISELIDKLPEIAHAVERGLLTHSDLHKLHSFIETVRNAPAYENAYPPSVSLARALMAPMNKQPQSFLSWLPNEVIVDIVCFLDVEEILTLRTTCKRIYSLTRLRYVWHSALHIHVIGKGLPVPSLRSISGPQYRMASSFDLEARAVHATRLHANFTSDAPKPTRAVQLHTGSSTPDADAEPLPRSLTAVKQIVFFDTSHGQQYLVAAFSVDCIGCWEISPDSGSIFHVAQWQCPHRISGVIVNEHAEYSDHDSTEGVIAVASHTETGDGLRITILALDKFRGHFTELGTFMNPHSSSVHVFRGFLLGFAENSSVVDWRDGLTCRLETEPWIDAADRTLAMNFIDDNLLLVVRENSMEVFLVSSAQVLCTQSTKLPVASFTTPCLAYEACVSGYYPQPPGAPISLSAQTRKYPVSVLLRLMDDGFDLVHLYVFDLEPRPSDGSLPSRPVRFPPTLVRALQVSPSCSQLHLGPSGRGYWLETRNVGSKRRSYPARCIIPLHIHHTQIFDPKLPNQWLVDLKVGTKPLYERRCGLQDLKEGKQRVSVVAQDDSVGRVAVGDVDGGIVVLDYA